MIRLKEANYGAFVVENVETGETLLVQTDYDFPGLAMCFGWSPCHPETDGTIDCPVCGRAASDMIAEAAEFLCGHLGDTAEDPGYF